MEHFIIRFFDFFSKQLTAFYFLLSKLLENELRKYSQVGKINFVGIEENTIPKLIFIFFLL